MVDWNLLVNAVSAGGLLAGAIMAWKSSRAYERAVKRIERFERHADDQFKEALRRNESEWTQSRSALADLTKATTEQQIAVNTKQIQELSIGVQKSNAELQAFLAGQIAQIGANQQKANEALELKFRERIGDEILRAMRQHVVEHHSTRSKAPPSGH